MAEFEGVQERMGHALADALPGEVVTRWVVVVEVVDAEGDRACYALAPPEAMVWDTLGLLTFALQREQAAAVSGQD